MAENFLLKTKLGVEFRNKLKQDLLTTIAEPKYANKNYILKNYERGLNQINEIIIHCTATDSQVWDDALVCINYDMKPNHISKRGCPTCTYHFYIDQPGEVDQLVSVYIETWHCKGHNSRSIAICINHGGEKEDIIEDAQMLSLIDTICYVFDFMDWEYTEKELRTRLHFHRDFANKLCPGVNLGKEHLIEECLKRFPDWGDTI